MTLRDISTPNPVHIEIVEILGRSQQGATKPFLCRGSDGNDYYVKGEFAGAKSHICEWMAGHLAVAFGLSVPVFGIATCPQELIDVHPEGRDLGPRPAFASRLVPSLSELTFSAVQRVPEQVQRDVFLLDLWLNNGDRSLSDLGGNPNLFWNQSTNKLVVFDFNQAFADDFDMLEFKELHAFRRVIPSLQNDLHTRDSYTRKFEKALTFWDSAWASMPMEWMFFDEHLTIETHFDMPRHRANLDRYKADGFWEFK